MITKLCGSCGYPLGIRKMKLKHGVVKIKAKCPNKHEIEFSVPSMMQDRWLNEAIKMVYTCEKCGAEITSFTEPELEDHYVKFYLICPHDGQRKRTINETIYYLISGADHSKIQGSGQATQPTPCIKCGSTIRWIPEYNRWYCDKCQEYQ